VVGWTLPGLGRLAVGEPGRRQRYQVAESFGGGPGRYDRARPGYPGALVEPIVAASRGRDVLDVGGLYFIPSTP
jgi:hypothetical protein